MNVQVHHGNRILFSFFAVALLWLSSLSVATSVAALVIDTPESRQVRETCASALRATQAQKRAYAKCVTRQVEQCREAYDAALQDEIASTLAASASNAEVLNVARELSASCSEALTNSRSALGEYASLATTHEIVYACDGGESDCDVECDDGACSCEDVANDIGDVSAVRTEAFAESTSFRDESTSTVSRVVAYSNDRADYDKAYVANKTATIQRAVAKAIEAIVEPFVALSNASFDGLFPAVDMLTSCVSTRDDANYTSCPLLEDARELFSHVHGIASNQLLWTKQTIEDMIGEVELFAANVEKSYEKISDLIDDIDKWWKKVKKAILVQVPDFIDLSPETYYVPPPRFCSQDIYETGRCNFDSPFDHYRSLPGASYLYPSELDAVYEAFVADITLASAETFVRATKLRTDLERVARLSPFGLEDYAPPQYGDYSDHAINASAEEARHAAEADSFVARQAVTLNTFAELQQQVEEDDAYSSYSLNLSSADFASSTDLDVFSWITLEKSRIDWGKIFVVGIGQLSALLLFFDYAWRTLQSYLTIRRFWSRSGIHLPMADLRFDAPSPKDEDKTTRRIEWCIKYGWIISMLFSSVALMAFFVALVAIAIAASYVPVYREYGRGCVRGHANGTFLSENLYSVAYNYASINGATKYSDLISEYDVMRTDACSEYSTASVEEFNDHSLLLSTYVASYEKTKDDIHKLRACVNIDAMDALFNEVCCGFEGYDVCAETTPATDQKGTLSNDTLCPKNSYSQAPYATVGEYLSTGTCLADETAWQLTRNAEFECDALPLCTTTCDGPNKNLLGSVTKQCACTFEYFAHAHFLRFALALCTYLLMNISRLLAVDAGCKLLWRKLSPRLFDCIFTSDPDGTIVLQPPQKSRDNPPSEMTDNPMREADAVGPSLIVAPKKNNNNNNNNAVLSPQYQALLQRELKTAVARWERTAWVELLFAISVNMLWIAFASKVRDDDVQYAPK